MKIQKLIFYSVLIVLLPMLLIACGDDKDKAEQNNKESNVDILSQTFSSSEGGVNLSFKYPDGWLTSAETGQVALANTQATLDLIKSTPIESIEIPSESYGLQIVLLPVADMPPDTSPVGLLEMMTETGPEGITFGEAEEIKVNGNDAAKIPATYGQSSGEIYLIKQGENYLLVSAAAASYDSFKPITHSIVETIQAS